LIFFTLHLVNFFVYAFSCSITGISDISAPLLVTLVNTFSSAVDISIFHRLMNSDDTGSGLLRLV